MGLFCSKKKQTAKKVEALKQRVAKISGKIDDYLIHWGPSFLSTADVFESVEELGRLAYDCLKKSKNWLSSITVREDSEPFIVEIEQALDEIREGYYKPQGTTAVVSGAEKIWDTVNRWAENK